MYRILIAFSLIVQVAFAATISSALLQPRFVSSNRAQTVTDGSVELTHDGYEGTLKSTFTATCGPKGVVTLGLTTKNTASVTFNVGVTGAIGGPPVLMTDAACNPGPFRLNFPDPAAPDNTDVDAEFTTTEQLICNRQSTLATVDGDGKPVLPRFTWRVLVRENIYEEDVSSTFNEVVSEVTVHCNQKVVAADANEVNDMSVTIIPEGAANFNQNLKFKITKTPSLVGPKWEFIITPEEPDWLGDKHFRLKSCVATPKLPTGTAASTLKADIIIPRTPAEGSCIKNKQTTLILTGTGASEVNQKLHILPFRFSAHPTAGIELNCDVELCLSSAGASGDASCAFVPRCPATVPVPNGGGESVGTRSKRSLPQSYRASFTFV